ncbi:L-rhamnose mutarotase [Brevundimonas sp. SPF441]|nr:L-rhamnose mutarotase [Brevundimonas sp. SPF441]
MQLKPGAVAEYKARHDAIWPQLAELLKNSGVSDYSIFLDEETLSLFAVLRRAENHTLDDLPNHPLMRKWWTHMAPLMEVEPGDKPREWSLQLMFHQA